MVELLLCLERARAPFVLACVCVCVCADIDECETMNCTNCCVNTVGSFVCTHGYYMFNNSECQRAYIYHSFSHR